MIAQVPKQWRFDDAQVPVEKWRSHKDGENGLTLGQAHQGPGGRTAFYRDSPFQHASSTRLFHGSDTEGESDINHLFAVSPCRKDVSLF